MNMYDKLINSGLMEGHCETCPIKCKTRNGEDRDSFVKYIAKNSTSTSKNDLENKIRKITNHWCVVPGCHVDRWIDDTMYELRPTLKSIQFKSSLKGENKI